MCKGCVCHECINRIDCDRCHKCNDGDKRIKSCSVYDRHYLWQCGACGQYNYDEHCSLCGYPKSDKAAVYGTKV